MLSFLDYKITKNFPYMQAFMRLFYCIYVSLTIAFKGAAWDCVAGEPLRGRAAAPSHSAAWLGADGSPRKGKKSTAGGGGHTINVWKGRD